MGIEPTQPAWKAGILAIELHPHICNGNYFTKLPPQCQVLNQDLRFIYADCESFPVRAKTDFMNRLVIMLHNIRGNLILCISADHISEVARALALPSILDTSSAGTSSP